MDTLLWIFAISQGITLKQTPVCFSNFVFVKEENFTGCQECREFELVGLSIQYLYFYYANIDNLLWDTACYEDTCWSRLGNPVLISHKVLFTPSYVSCPEKEMHYISTRYLWPMLSKINQHHEVIIFPKVLLRPQNMVGLTSKNQTLYIISSFCHYPCIVTCNMQYKKVKPTIFDIEYSSTAGWVMAFIKVGKKCL